MSSEGSRTLDELKKEVLAVVAPNHCYGTVPLQTSEGSIFFKKDEASDSKYINFATRGLEDDSDLLSLVEVSERATFGRDDQDVLDESYRKAWKLDVSQFAVQFDLVSSGIIETVQNQLLHYETSNLSLEPQLYKLNVYGPGSFFKPHIDTPRSDRLLATLVVVLPTVHTGGNLLLGKEGSILNFDSAKLVYDSKTRAPKVAFAAFYSDIEHEVLPVESGYRVTLAYNLYTSQSPTSSVIFRSPASESYRTLRRVLRKIMASTDVLERGGSLGFGLLSRYPMVMQEGKASLSKFRGALKGNDAMIKNACRAVGLDVSVKVLYIDKGRYSDSLGASWIADTLKTDWEMGDCEESLGDRFRGVADRVVEDAGAAADEGEEESPTPILWVTPPSKLVRADMALATYGNEPSMMYVYGELVLIATKAKAASKNVGAS